MSVDSRGREPPPVDRRVDGDGAAVPPVAREPSMVVKPGARAGHDATAPADMPTNNRTTRPAAAPPESPHPRDASAAVARSGWRCWPWRIVAAVALVLAAVGVVVPGLPTVPFLLVAAWAAERGWPALERWLVTHGTYGPLLLRWRMRRAIPRRAKIAASVAMAASAALLQFTTAPATVRVGVPVLMLAVATWMWRRPDD